MNSPPSIGLPQSGLWYGTAKQLNPQTNNLMHAYRKKSLGELAEYSQNVTKNFIFLANHYCKAIWQTQTLYASVVMPLMTQC